MQPYALSCADAENFSSCTLIGVSKNRDSSHGSPLFGRHLTIKTRNVLSTAVCNIWPSAVLRCMFCGRTPTQTRISSTLNTISWNSAPHRNTSRLNKASTHRTTTLALDTAATRYGISPAAKYAPTYDHPVIYIKRRLQHIPTELDNF